MLHERVARAAVVVLLAGLAMVVSAVPFAGCDSEWVDNSSSSQAPDSGDQGASPGTDAAGDDGGGDDGGGGQDLPDGAIPPQGTQLAVGSTFELEGVTSDGYAIYADTSAMTLNAAPVDGGAAIKIGTTDQGGPAVQVTGPVVFDWTAINQNTGSATLTIWTSANASQALSTSSQAPSGFESATVSADGTLVAFYDSLSADGNTANLDVASTDGTTAPTVVMSGINIGDTGCFPSFGFAGSAIVAAYPPSKGDAGVTDAAAPAADAGAAQYVATVTLFSGATWTPTTLTTAGYCGIALDPAGTEALLATATGLSARAVADPTKSVALDPKGVWGQFTSSADGGLDVLYTDKVAALKRVAATANATPEVLVTAGLHDIAALSPDGNWTLASNVTALGTSGTVSDLYLASATTPGAATPLVTTPISSPIGDWFTADSTHALYGASVSSDAGVTSNALFAVATSGGTPAQLTPNVGSVFATSGGKIVFNSNDGSGGYDLMADDTSSSTGSTLLVSIADQAFFLTAGKDQIVYTWSYTTDNTAGVYVMPVP